MNPMSPTALLILAAGAIGHVVLWVAVVNRVHAMGIARRWIDLSTAIAFILLASLPFAVAVVLAGFVPADASSLGSVLSRAVWTYLTFCTAVLIVAVVQRLRWQSHPERRGLLRRYEISPVQFSESQLPLLIPGIPSLLGSLPGNEVLKLQVERKTLVVPRFPKDVEPLRIAHLTDLHMSGRITRAYFEQAVHETNALAPDIVAITGDIVECDPCLDWIPDTLGRLRATSGVYYVLGNHDKHVDISKLHGALGASGLIHVEANCHQISVRGVPIVIGRNELPWFSPASSFDDCPPRDSSGLPLRILLSHSPDQFAWAQARDVDVMLAGHLHGGQVRLPGFGAIFSPSNHGVRYMAGVFTAGNSVMHVSRGTGSLTPLRYNCPPEISLLTLVAPQA